MTHPQIGRALRLMNMEKNGTPTVAEFQALLTDQGRLDACVELLRRPGTHAQLAGYPALYQALSSSAALQDMAPTDAALMKLVASIPAAMTGFISSQSALSAIADNAAVRAAFIASTALAAASVPAMTSDTAPSGAASAKTIYGAASAAWLAFDGNDATYWNSAGAAAGEWIQYQFPSDVCVHSMTVSQYGSGFSPKDCVLQKSVDGVIFSDAKAMTLPATGVASIDVASAGFCQYWRLSISNNHGAGYAALKELSFTGFVKP